MYVYVMYVWTTLSKFIYSHLMFYICVWSPLPRDSLNPMVVLCIFFHTLSWLFFFPQTRKISNIYTQVCIHTSIYICICICVCVPKTHGICLGVSLVLFREKDLLHSGACLDFNIVKTESRSIVSNFFITLTVSLIVLCYII